MGYLDSLGIKYGTDKSSKCHDYLDFYEDIITKMIKINRIYSSILEIGVLAGSSIKMWRDFFRHQNAGFVSVIGMDTFPMQPIDGAMLITGDAYSPEGLSLIEKCHASIIIDDGSHKSPDIIKLVDYLTENKVLFHFPDLFIFEDCHAAFYEEYTPKGTINAYEYCLQKFESLGLNVMVKKKYGDFSDSVTMAVTREKI